ncbi:hypothetical protein Bbelb_365840 [Branchiostoma belcheri]|nr:hypothetical protein Bbelb_365840 [Branchiostoma belcheri]
MVACLQEADPSGLTLKYNEPFRLLRYRTACLFVVGYVYDAWMLDNTRQKSSKLASRHKLAAILDIVGNVRYRRRERSVASRLPKPDRKLSDYNRKGYRAFPMAVADIPDYIQDGRQLVPTVGKLGTAKNRVKSGASGSQREMCSSANGSFHDSC